MIEGSASMAAEMSDSLGMNAIVNSGLEGSPDQYALLARVSTCPRTFFT